ncbi:hypothetical protein GCM10009087_08160 [Sphingomonas oligophenolica]|uniref:Alpha/beta hydrolase n=1 Tax=Sphingomonas oligophenolica TaxID=301154 RepID=A0ABU9XXN7_9SPHN
MIDDYDWPGGREAMLRFGPATGPVVIAAMPLFEEANHTRAFIVTILRALAERGVASALPDLPGTGESLIETEEISLNIWQKAFSCAAKALKGDHGPPHGIAFRGGALFDSTAPLASRWHFAPVAGESLVRDMLRTRLAAGKAGDAIDPTGPVIELAGNRLSHVLLAELERATPSSAPPLRVVRLDTDTLSADRRIAGPPLWRRTEPGNDQALARQLADDIAAWIATCAA